MSLNAHNPPNPEWISLHNLSRFAYPPGENPQDSSINRAATDWYNAVLRRMYQGLFRAAEIRGFPDHPKPPRPPRLGTMEIEIMRPPGPGNPQGGAFAHGGSIKPYSFFK